MPKDAIRQCGLPGFELQDYVAESIAFLKEHEPSEGYFVGFSGGKDSITTLALCRMAGVRHQAFYSCTRIDPPEMMTFIKKSYPQVTWLYPKKSFWKLVRKKAPPFRMMRWCCDALKKAPSRHIPLSQRVMGIRAEESARRAKLPRVDKYNRKQTILKPIFYWPEWAVWEFIETEHLPYPSLYDEGWSRIGCVVCPFILGSSPAQRAHVRQSMERWPGIWKVFEKTVKDWFTLTMKDGVRRNQSIKTPQDFWETYLRGG